MKSFVAITGLLCAASAAAWPVDVYVDAPVGTEKFQKASGTQWVAVENSAVAEVELLPGEELLVTPKKAGETRVLLYGEGRMGVWSVRTGEPVRASESPVLTACPGARLNPSSATDKLVVTIRSEACRKALLALLKNGVYHSREITLTFDIPVLQSQLREVQTAVDAAVGPKRVESVYAGGSLRLRGDVTTAEHKKILWAVFDVSVGRVTLDDKLQLTDAPNKDAGTAATP